MMLHSGDTARAVHIIRQPNGAPVAPDALPTGTLLIDGQPSGTAQVQSVPGQLGAFMWSAPIQAHAGASVHMLLRAVLGGVEVVRVAPLGVVQARPMPPMLGPADLHVLFQMMQT